VYNGTILQNHNNTCRSEMLQHDETNLFWTSMVKFGSKNKRDIRYKI